MQTDEEATLEALGLLQVASSLWLVFPCAPMLPTALTWLQRITDFGPQSEPHHQQKEMTGREAHVNLLLNFVNSIKPDHERSAWRPCKGQLAMLKSSVQALGNIIPSEESPFVHFYGEYGCALVVTQIPVETLVLTLIGLDAWKFSIHSGPSERSHKAISDTCQSATLFIGKLEKSRFERFQLCAKAFLTRAKTRRGDERTAAKGDQGNQKTPAMIKAVLLDALRFENDVGLEKDLEKELEKELEKADGGRVPGGGFTDVGLHTGGTARNTIWPLHCAVLQTFLEQQGHNLLYREFVIQLYLRLAESATNSLLVSMEKESSAKHSTSGIMTRKIVRDVLDTIMQTLEFISIEAPRLAALNPEAVCVAFLEARCVRVRFELEKATQLRANRAAEFFQVNPLKKNELQWRYHRLAIPAGAEDEHIVDYSQGLVVARRHAALNLSALPVLNPKSSTWHQLESWTTHVAFRDNLKEEAMLLFCKTVEEFFFEKVLIESLDEPKTTNELQNLDNVLSKYRTVAWNLRNSKTSKAFLTVELMSRELLVVWAAFCLVRKTAEHLEPLLRKYSVAIDADSLRHLVLSDKKATDAALRVAEFLRSHSGNVCIFSFRKNDSTLAFALEHAQQNLDALNVWEMEQMKAATREEARWKDILNRQSKLISLDQQLEILKRNQQHWCGIRDEIYNTMTKNNELGIALTRLEKGLQKARNEIDNLSGNIMLKKHQISTAEQIPKPIFQPLPKGQNALRIIFFLRMPLYLRVLSKLSFMSQHLLMAGLEVENVKKPDTAWSHYYQSESIGGSFDIWETALVLGLNRNNICLQNSNNVRQCHSSSDGVWYPDQWTPRLVWYGSGLSMDSSEDPINPFNNIPVADSAAKFTESLSPGNKKSWEMIQRGIHTPKRRENLALALLNEISPWLFGKNSFLSYGNIRSFPYQQVRKLCIALKDRTLPLGHDNVRTLIQQTVYHIGDMPGDGETILPWRTDLFHFDGWNVLHQVLHDLVDELKCKPREHGSMLILAQLAAFASQWNENCRDTARNISRVVRTWARDLSEEKERAKLENVGEMRSRMSLFYMYGIICHSKGELSRSDVRDLCELTLLADYNRLFEELSPLDEEVKSVTSATFSAVALRMNEILDVVEADPGFITGAVRLFLRSVPQSLSWIPVQDQSGGRMACFEAESTSGNLFSVNLYTGVTLVNGMPPRKLPAMICENALYKRTFLDRNFEVFETDSESFQTTSPVNHCKYTFTLKNGALIVRESRQNGDEKMEMELLAVPDKDSSWGQDLPTRLRTMHSHWICRETNTILLRGIQYHQRDIFFLLLKKNGVPHSSLSKWICYQVPQHKRNLSLAILSSEMRSYDHLVCVKNIESLSAYRTVLNFESHADLIHTIMRRTPSKRPRHIRTPGVFVLSIPRYGLEFETSSGGRLISCNFKSYHMSPRQQRNDILHDFTQYLIIKSSMGKEKVLVPSGEIKRDEKSVYIDVSRQCDANQRYFTYDVHPRFHDLHAPAGALVKWLLICFAVVGPTNPYQKMNEYI